ncbi:MAG: hypothetical protein ACRD2B_10055 [Terriglobia bacterium]
MKITRKHFLAMGVAGAATAFAGSARGELVETLQEWHQASFRKAATRPARIRQVYDITEINHGVFLNNIKNSLNGFQFGFGLAPREFNVIAALHGNANLLHFDDSMWKKYKLGEYAAVTDPRTGSPATRNIFYSAAANPADKNPDSEKSIYQDHSIEGLERRNVSFLLCHTATEEQSRKLKKRLGLAESPESIVRDLLAHTIPGSIVVPSMVATVAVLQLQFHFSYITVA